MSKKKPTPPSANSPEPPLIRLQRLDAEGGFLELDPEHAQRLLDLEAAMNVRNYALYAPDTDNARPDKDTRDLEG